MSILLQNTRASRTPARLDFAQSVSGLLLAIFLWAHLIFVSSILLGKDAMYFVTKMMEAAFLHPEGTGYPLLVTGVGISIFALFILHAALAVRKFPINLRQYREIRDQMKMMNHSDTNLWYWQVVTGFLLFFFASIHIYMITSNPALIGPFASADRFVTQWMWPVYLVLIFAAEIHGAVGVYRLAVKWGIFDGADPKANRKRLKMLKKGMTFFFVTLGLLTFFAYVKIGIEHRDKAGERYVPTQSMQQGLWNTRTQA